MRDHQKIRLMSGMLGVWALLMDNSQWWLVELMRGAVILLAIVVACGELIVAYVCSRSKVSRAALGRRLFPRDHSQAQLWLGAAMTLMAAAASTANGFVAALFRPPGRGEGRRFLDLLSLVLPKRVADEELGDAMEEIEAMIKRGDARWRVWVKIASAAAWAISNSLRFGTRIPPKPAAPAGSQDTRPPAQRGGPPQSSES